MAEKKKKNIDNGSGVGGYIRNTARRLSGAVRKMNALSNEELITNDTFERLRRRNKYKKLRRALLCAAIGAVCCVIFTVVCCSVFFRVSEIDIEGSTIYHADVLREASGIKIDENLLSIDEGLVENNIVMNYPYIKSVKLSRLIPTTVELDVTEDKPRYYTEVCGEYFVLSDTMRVLQRADGIGVLRADYNLCALKLPEISYAVVGRPVKFQRDTSESYITEFLSWLDMSGFGDKVGVVSLSDKYRIYFTYNDSFKIVIGKNEELDLKLKLINEIMATLEGGRGIIDVSTIEPSFAILDASVDLS